MTEAEWASCSNPRSMLNFLRGRVSERKLWLFGVACLRNAWDSLPDTWRFCAEVEERYADGHATAAEVNAVWRKRVSVEDESVEWPVVGEAWGNTQETASDAVAWQGGHGRNGDYQSLATAQCELLRDIFGNPFRTVALRPEWLNWNGGAVVKLAKTIYEDRRFELLPMLGDALESAGCADQAADQAIAEHCRGPGPHVRGCWVVDLLLGKE